MANRFLGRLRSLVGKGEKEDIIELRELVKAFELINIKGRRQKQVIQELPKRSEAAQRLVIDARKHSIRLQKTSEQLMNNLNSLPQSMQRVVKDEERQSIAITKNIKQHLDRLAEYLAVQSHTGFTVTTMGIQDELSKIINAVRRLFALEAKVAQFLKTVEEQSR